jgi:hypothetical protein
MTTYAVIGRSGSFYTVRACYNADPRRVSVQSELHGHYASRAQAKAVIAEHGWTLVQSWKQAQRIERDRAA